MQNPFLYLRSLMGYWSSHWSSEDDEPNRKHLSFFIRIGSILFVYMIIDRVIIRITRLPLEDFHEPFIFISLLKHIVTGWYVLILAGFVIGLLYFRKNLLTPWSDFTFGNSIRWILLVAAGILAWQFSASDYNYYFGQGYYIDRILVLLLLLLLYFRPIFIVPFLFFYLPTIWQVTVLPTTALTMLLLPIRILILFCSFHFLLIVNNRFHIGDFVFLLGCLLAAHYWLSGYGKLSFDWIWYDQIYFLLPATYANGWLGFLEAESISRVTRMLSYLNLPMKIFTLVVEFGAVLFLINRHSIRFFLVGWALFHLGIFFVSGIFFWMWILPELVLLWMFLKKDGFSELHIFTKKHLAASVVLIVFANYWCNPVMLAWFDVPVNYTYRFEAENFDGEVYELPPRFFAPFESQITLGGFSFLDKKSLLPVMWGVTKDPGIARELSIMPLSEEFVAFEKKNGTRDFNEIQRESLDKFITQFVKNRNESLPKSSLLNYFQAPLGIYTFPAGVHFSHDKRIRKIKISQVTSFYENGIYKEFRTSLLHEILISE